MSRRSNGTLWNDVRNDAGCYFDDYNMQKRQHITAFAAAVRIDEAEHVRQECEERAIKWNRHELPGMSLSEAILSAGKAPALKPGMLVEWNGSMTGTKYVQEWSPENDARFGEKERESLRPLTRAEIMAYADKAPE